MNRTVFKYLNLCSKIKMKIIIKLILLFYTLLSVSNFDSPPHITNHCLPSDREYSIIIEQLVNSLPVSRLISYCFQGINCGRMFEVRDLDKLTEIAF